MGCEVSGDKGSHGLTTRDLYASFLNSFFFFAKIFWGSYTRKEIFFRCTEWEEGRLKMSVCGSEKGI